MIFSEEKIWQLFNSIAVIEIENEIAKTINCEIYRDNIHLLIDFLKDEIEISGLSITQIEDFINSNKREIVKFGVRLLESNPPKSLSSGIAISYSIYMIYLKDEEKDLLAYIKRRRIPQAQKLFTKLQKIKEAMNL